MTVPFSTRLTWPAPDNRLSALRAELRTQGVSVLDFSESNPTRVGLGPSPEQLATLLNPANAHYAPNPRGLPRAREVLAADYRARGGPGMQVRSAVRVDPEDLFLCASTSEAYGWLFKLLCDPGDAVLVPKPGYPLFDYLAGLEAVEARPYRLEYAHPGGWRIDLESVTEALRGGRTRALVVINPNNPTGSYVRRDEREALLALCEQHDCALIADEVFYDFAVDGQGGRSSFIGEERVLCFVLDGLSKRLGMPQMKLGWIVASGPALELRAAEGRLEILADAYLSAGTPIMNALPALLPAAAAFAGDCRRRLRANIAQLRDTLEGPHSPHRVLTCAGGWTAIVESPGLLPEEELALGLLRVHHVWSLPGYFFDVEREAHFTVGLILEPHALRTGAQAYGRHFERLLAG